MVSWSEYDLYQKGLLGRIRGDEKAFRVCMTANYVRIARQFGCDVHVSASRLGDTFVYWLSDLDRVLGSDTSERTVQLDHFKQAAFLCFWLRRHVPVGFTFFNPKPIEDAEPSRKQKFFSFYGNEICALRIGISICHAYELKRLFGVLNSAPKNKVTEIRGLRRRLKGREILEPEFEIDFVTTLKHKNNSPHSINLIFRSIFSKYRAVNNSL